MDGIAKDGQGSGHGADGGLGNYHSNVGDEQTAKYVADRRRPV